MFALNYSYPPQCFYLLNYKIWDTPQEGVYKTKVKDVHGLRERIVDECDKLDQRVIDKVIGEWRKRLWAWVVAGGGQFEHNMWTFLIADVLSRYSRRVDSDCLPIT